MDHTEGTYAAAEMLHALFDRVVVITPRVPEDTLAGPLRAAGIETRLVGDCRAPGGLLAATSDGHAAGNEI
jgi:hypothetical protein